VIVQPLTIFFDCSNLGCKKQNVNEDVRYYSMILKLIMNNNPWIIFAMQGNMYSYTSRMFLITPAVLQLQIHENTAITYSLLNLSVLVRYLSSVLAKFYLMLQCALKLGTITPMVLIYLWSNIPVTPTASLNALLESKSLTNLTLLCLYSTISFTLLEASSDYIAHCTCLWQNSP